MYSSTTRETLESLSYPASQSTPPNDSQIRQLKTLFGWVFPDWTVGQSEV